MHCLEAALASPAPTRERRWAARARKDLELVRGLLQAHVLSAEGPGGLFEELDITRPTVAHRVAELRQEHSHLLLLANDLCHSLDPSPALPDFSALRHQAARFLTALRHHHAAEVDLLLECFWTDIGVGD